MTKKGNGLENGIAENVGKNLILIANSRTYNQDPNHNSTKGAIFEELTCLWRGVKSLNIENDNYNSPIDHSIDPELGIIQTKGKLYDNINGVWCQNWENEYNKEFDYLIFYCASRDGKIIERIYIFPWKEVIKITGISIYKNPSKEFNGMNNIGLKMKKNLRRSIIYGKK